MTPDEDRAYKAKWMRDWTRKQREADPAAWKAKCREIYQKRRERKLVENKAYREDNREEVRARDLARRRNRHLEYLLTAARGRCKNSGLEFTITVADVVVPAVCPYLGIPIILSLGERKRFDTSPSLDRIDTRKGYVPGNVEVISWRANRIKGDLLPEEVAGFVAALQERFCGAR